MDCNVPQTTTLGIPKNMPNTKASATSKLNHFLRYMRNSTMSLQVTFVKLKIRKLEYIRNDKTQICISNSYITHLVNIFRFTASIKLLLIRIGNPISA